MVNDYAVELMRGAIATILTPDQMARAKAVDAAMDRDGKVYQESVAPVIPWQRVDFFVSGALSAGYLPQRFAVPQGGVIRRVHASVRTAPTGGALNINIMANTTRLTAVSIAAGTGDAVPATGGEIIPAGVYLQAQIVNPYGAQNLTLTVFFTIGGV